MLGNQGRRYRAFLSYSHKDSAAGSKLFRRLDGYRPPKSLIGRETPFGPVPAKLYPVFRDREELAAGGLLPERIREALAASDHLVVLCSPNAAASPWVNQEVAGFRALGKGERIHAVLADGDPQAAFPPALTAAIDEPVAADLRKAGDGWTDGPLKLIAGLLGVPFGELKDREVARARFRARVYAAVAGLFAVLAIVAGVSAWRAVEQTRRAEVQLGRAEAAILTAVEGVSRIVEQVAAGSETGQIPTGVAKTLLTTADDMISGVIGLAPDNPRLKVEQGKVLILFARHYKAVGDAKAAADAATRARDLYAQLERSPASATQAAGWRSVALDERGDALLAAGERDGALAAYEESLAIARRLAEADPGNAQWARDLSVSLEKIGNARMAAGERDGALAAYEESLGIARRLAAADPGNAEWARDLSVSLDRIGDARMAAGERAGALSAYEESLEMRRRLAEADPGNAQWARDVSVSLEKIGDARMAAGERAGALAAYEESLRIARRLAAADPGNAQWARDLSVSLDRIGNARMAAGERAGALTAYEESLEMRRRLAEADPGNAQWARDLSVSLEKIGNARMAAGERAGALAAYEESLAIRRRLAASDPGNAQWARDLAVSHWRLAEYGAEPTLHWREVVRILKALDDAGRLAPVDQQWLAIAEQNLAASKGK